MPRRPNYLLNDYRLPNRNNKISKEELERLLTDFEFFMGNYQQIVTKERTTVPFKLNNFQRRLFAELLPMVHPKTRVNKRKTVVVLKPRQVGASTGIVAFINYICAYVEGMNHLNILHVFPVKDTVDKFYKDKVSPIITGVHPIIFPHILTQKISSSIITTYQDVKGIPRDNVYELISANASSIRSASVHVALFDEASAYDNPDDLEGAIIPALPRNGFSLVVYLSTFEDKKSYYFTDKIKTAMENHEDYSLIFSPWYDNYPEERKYLDHNTIQKNIYDKTTIIPALEKDGIPEEDWGDMLDWHHAARLDFRNNLPRMQKEYPTTVQELLDFSESESVFDDVVLEEMKEAILLPKYHRITQDALSHKLELKESEDSPLKIYKQPISTHSYILTVDPILATGENTDFFAASMFDRRTHEQVAVIHGRDLPLDDWAVLSAHLATIYNKAIICPESNFAQPFFATAFGMGYYNWYYRDAKCKAHREVGLRTNMVSRRDMIEALSTMLRYKTIKIYDGDTLDELTTFKKVKNKKSSSFKLQAAGKNQYGDTAHDDLVASLWIYAGTLNHIELTGAKRVGWGVI